MRCKVIAQASQSLCSTDPPAAFRDSKLNMLPFRAEDEAEGQTSAIVGTCKTRRLSETNQRIHVPHSLTRKPGQQGGLSQAGCSSWVSAP